jgi:hypothetical protein
MLIKGSGDGTNTLGAHPVSKTITAKPFIPIAHLLISKDPSTRP